MKNLLHVFLLFLSTFFGAHAQQEFQADSVDVSRSNSASFSEEFARWNVRIYPLAAITNLRAEVGYRFSEEWEVNLLGGYYYQKFFWYRSSGSAIAVPYYLQADGAQLFLSVEKRLAKNRFSMGGRIGYREVGSVPFTVLGDNPGQSYSVVLDQNRTDLLFLFRVKSQHKGVFIEFIAQGGLSRFIIYETGNRYQYKEFLDTYSDVNAYWLPTISAGINVGFGW